LLDSLLQEKGKLGCMSINMSNIQQQMMVVEQLRREANIKRISVSTAVEDIKKYVGEHRNEDCLLVGFQPRNPNPFRERSSCTLLWSVILIQILFDFFNVKQYQCITVSSLILIFKNTKLATWASLRRSSDPDSSNEGNYTLLAATSSESMSRLQVVCGFPH